MKYQVTITHDNRKRTLTMSFKDDNKISLTMMGPYKLDGDPTHSDMKRQLETAAISTVTAYDVLGAKGYNDMCERIGTMSDSERKAILSTIATKHPKGLLPDIIYKEV